MLELHQVTKVYGARPAVQAIDLFVPEGTTMVIIGPSGCGKSTLMRIINGLVIPDSGCVRFLSQLLTQTSALPLRRKMGYVIQDGALFPHLTARENVGLMARQLRWLQARIAARVSELAALTRFPVDALERYPTQLSGGQRQRVALMRALLLDPTLLLLDEPLGALDPMVRYDLQTDLKAVFRALGKTVVLVTHDLGEAAYFGDEVILLNDGRIEQQGPMATLIESPRSLFAERFVRAQRGLVESLAAGSPPV
ncbi:MAG: ATP-binding cassette domain-containing protein [Gammaproteobacteria bacterium]